MLNQPFFQVALPIMVTLVVTVWAATWTQNKRLDEISKRIDDLARRLDRIEARLDQIESRLNALEVRAWR